MPLSSQPTEQTELASSGWNRGPEKKEWFGRSYKAWQARNYV